MSGDEVKDVLRARKDAQAEGPRIIADLAKRLGMSDGAMRNILNRGRLTVAMEARVRAALGMEVRGE